MMRLIPLLSLLIAVPAAANAANAANGDVRPVSFVSSAVTSSPQWQLQTLGERDDTASLPEVSVQSPRYQAPASQDQASAPVGAFQAIPWAVAHPSQAFRILLPSSN